MSIISASTLTSTALQYTANTTGTLVFQTGATPTTALTLNADQSATFAGTVNFAAAAFTNLSYTGTLTGGTGVVNLGSGQFYKDSSGNVGVGITSPAYKLHSAGTVGSGSTGTNGYYGLKRSSDGAELGSFNTDGTNIVTNAGTNIVFQRAGTESMRIDTSGNLLVGTTTAIAPLTVSGTTNGGTAWFQHNGGNAFGTVLTLETIGGTDDPSLSFKNYNGGSPTYYGISGTDDGSLAFKAGASSGGFGTERMRISSVGYLTIPYQVSFNAATTTSIGTGATVVPFTSTNHNIGGAFSTSTGRFTAPIAGRYLITAGIAFAGATYYDIILRKNGAALGNSQFGQNGGGSGYPQSSITQVIQLAAGDYIDMYMTGASAGVSRTDFTYFTGQLLG